MVTTLHIHATYDAEARVWWAESGDLPGLVSEAETLDALIERVSQIAPELIALNQPGLEDVTLEFHTLRALQAA